MTKGQDLPPSAPGSVNPQTEMGIRVLNAVIGFASWSGLAKGTSAELSNFSGPIGEDKRLPLYDFRVGDGAREP